MTTIRIAPKNNRPCRLNHSSWLLVLLAVFFISAVMTSPMGAKSKQIDHIQYPALKTFKLPEIHSDQTSSGIKLRLIKDEKLPLVEMIILVKGGNIYDPLDKFGLATIVAQMLRIGGTGQMPPEKLDELLDSKGISINFDANTDYFSISLTCLQENFDEALNILSQMLQHPAMSEEKFEETKSRMSSAISRRNDDPESIAYREFDRMIYGNNSPFSPVVEYEHLENIQREDLFACYRSFFAPGNFLVGIVGPVEMKEVKEIFEKHFASWDHKANIPAYPKFKAPQQNFKVAFIEKANVNQSFFSIGHLGVQEDPTDYDEKAKIMVFNSIFSQGFASRLTTRIRVKMGLTYGISGGVITERLYPGTTFFSTYTKSESTVAAIEAIFDEIKKIRKETVTGKELQDAKDYFLNSYVFRFSSPERILRSSLSREFYGIPKNFQEKLLDSVKKVTAADVLATAQKYLHPEEMKMLIVGKEEAIGTDLSALGKVKKIDVSIPPPPVKEKIPAPTAESLAKGKQIIETLAKGKYRGYRNLKSLKLEAETKLSVSGQKLTIGLKSTSLLPGKYYREMNVMGMKIEFIVNGDKGIIKQMGQERPLSAEQLEDTRYGNLYSIFNETGKYRFQYLKEADIDGQTYDIIYIRYGSQNWVKYFINRKTQLIEIEESQSKFPGTSGIAREIKSSFKVIKNIPYAFKSEVYVKDQLVSDTDVKNVVVNPQVDQSLFKLK